MDQRPPDQRSLLPPLSWVSTQKPTKNTGKQKEVPDQAHSYYASGLVMLKNDRGEESQQRVSLGKVTDIFFTKKNKLLKVRTDDECAIIRNDIPFEIKEMGNRNDEEYIEKLKEWLSTFESLNVDGYLEISLTDTGSWSTNVHPNTNKRSSARTSKEFVFNFERGQYDFSDIRFSRNDITLSNSDVICEFKKLLPKNIEIDINGEVRLSVKGNDDERAEKRMREYEVKDRSDDEDSEDPNPPDNYDRYLCGHDVYDFELSQYR